ncbi:MAG: acetyltransferase [Anaerocolumna sp.]|jgi:N-acetylglutamate synthase-like GNAT family acetyltransferase|nr:acetyltransferase [Anaerocolumna sp.]
MEGKWYNMKKSIESTIRKINGSMALEGMSLTEEDKNRIRDIDEGKTTIELEIGKLNKKYMKNDAMMDTIKKIKDEDKKKIIDFLRMEWGSTIMVLREGEVFDLKDEDGFVIYDKDNIIGLITYRITNNRCEILSLDSKIENKGIGTGLVEKVKEHAKNNQCSLCRVVTTNDNLKAIGFFQKRGFHLVNLYVKAMDTVRKIKPDVPKKGMDNIPLNDELEFEMNI